MFAIVDFFVPTSAYGASVVKKTGTKNNTQKKTTKKAAPKKKATKNTQKATGTVRSSAAVRKEKQQTEQEIAATKKKINENEKKITRQLHRLSDLDNQIQQQVSTIDELTATIDELTERTLVLNDSLAMLQQKDSVLSKQVANALRRQHVQRHLITPLAFVMGASNVKEARQRLNYWQALQRAENKYIVDLRKQRRLIDATRQQIDSVQAGHEAAVKQLTTAKDILDARRVESQKVMKGLQKESSTLKKVLEEKSRKMKQLDNELNRIIAEEQRRAQQAAAKNSGTGSKSTGGTAKKPAASGVAEETRALTGTFAANKGKLLFPVNGRYSIVGTFGRSQHSELSHVQMDNSGIDISVGAGSNARAVFEGTVSSIFFTEGYENVVIVRHGEYLTVYAGLSSLDVRKGQKIKAGQAIGRIATIDGSTVLHFEVRKEREKLNPMAWVK